VEALRLREVRFQESKVTQVAALFQDGYGLTALTNQINILLAKNIMRYYVRGQKTFWAQLTIPLAHPRAFQNQLQHKPKSPKLLKRRTP
jgi:hypothetical protein